MRPTRNYSKGKRWLRSTRMTLIIFRKRLKEESWTSRGESRERDPTDRDIERLWMRIASIYQSTTLPWANKTPACTMLLAVIRSPLYTWTVGEMNWKPLRCQNLQPLWCMRYLTFLGLLKVPNLSFLKVSRVPNRAQLNQRREESRPYPKQWASKVGLHPREEPKRRRRRPIREVMISLMVVQTPLALRLLHHRKWKRWRWKSPSYQSVPKKRLFSQRKLPRWTKELICWGSNYKFGMQTEGRTYFIKSCLNTTTREQGPISMNHQPNG